MTREEELLLVRAVQRGSTEAFEQLYTENERRVYALALRMCGNEQDAMDAAQDAFLKAYRAIGSFRGESAFSTWLYRLTANAATDLLRKRRTGRIVSLEELQEREEGFDPPAAAPTPEEEAEEQETRRELNEALQQLNEDSRRILLLREIGGLSYEELSRELQLEVGTVKSRLNRARARLCTLMKRDGNKRRDSASKDGERR